MVYTLRFFLSSKCSLFHNSNLFGSCIIHILYTGCVKIKKNNSGSKRLTTSVDLQITKVRCVSREAAILFRRLRGNSSQDTVCVLAAQDGQLSIATGTAVAVLGLFRPVF